MTLLKLYFSRRWWWTTVLMLFAVGVMIRLGFWQLDRMASQKAFNEHVRLMQAAEPLDLNRVADAAGLPGMEFRAAVASGHYDFDHQVALRNQYWGDPDGTAVYGYHLLTPLVLEDGLAVLVDRGWIPGEYAARASWSRFDEDPQAAVSGILRLPLLEGEMGAGVPDPTAAPGHGGLAVWNYIDPVRLERQLPYPLLPVYLQQAPTGDQDVLPYKVLPALDLSDGTHLGYALQWFLYACLVFFGYPVYLRRQAGAGKKQPRRSR